MGVLHSTINELSKPGLRLRHMEIDTNTLEELSGFEAGKDIVKGKIGLRIDGFLGALTDEAKKKLYLKLITNVVFIDKLRYKLKEINGSDDMKIDEVLIQTFEEALNGKNEMKVKKKNNQLLDTYNSMKTLEDLLISFFDDVQVDEEKFQNIIQFIYKNNDNKYDLKLFLRIINSISLNHIRKSNSIGKIEQILKTIGSGTGENKLCDIDYLEIFAENLRILLFLFENNFITFSNIPDDFLIQIFNDQNTIKYFHKELTLAGKINKFVEHPDAVEYKIGDPVLYEKKSETWGESESNL